MYRLKIDRDMKQLTKMGQKRAEENGRFAGRPTGSKDTTQRKRACFKNNNKVFDNIEGQIVEKQQNG